MTLLVGGKSYIAHGDVFNQFGVEVASLVDLLQQAVDQVVEVGVLEAALVAFREGRSDSEGDDHIVGILLCAVVSRQP